MLKLQTGLQAVESLPQLLGSHVAQDLMTGGWLRGLPLEQWWTGGLVDWWTGEYIIINMWRG